VSDEDLETRENFITFHTPVFFGLHRKDTRPFDIHRVDKIGGEKKLTENVTPLKQKHVKAG
jgi:hypothetical protein